ncbi:MAG: hypothetical protein INQ03_06565 [Candidatus Heimdallarchaeota archaeon]|nr:hypothetical protein [Candidatus Heimdallarchaeota archaeon]
MNLKISELRYSLNGITEAQLQILFDLLDNEQDQMIFKRVSEPRFSISNDDIIITGAFSHQFIHTLSQILPPPLVLKVENPQINPEIFQDYAAKRWDGQITSIFAGITMFPIKKMAKIIGYSYGDQFIKLLSTTPAGSKLKPYLITKAKGLIESFHGGVSFILPLHRMDFTIEWLRKIISDEVDFNWVSGETGQLPSDLVGTNGTISSTIEQDMMKWVNSMKIIDPIDLHKYFRRALKVVS